MNVQSTGRANKERNQVNGVTHVPGRKCNPCAETFTQGGTQGGTQVCSGEIGYGNSRAHGLQRKHAMEGEFSDE